jgi:hypothetical protein
MRAAPGTVHYLLFGLITGMLLFYDRITSAQKCIWLMKIVYIFIRRLMAGTKRVNFMRIPVYMLCAAIVLLPAACTWVDVTKEGSEVILVKSENVATCTRLGTTTASVAHKIGPLTRSEEKVKEELVTLARNKAAEMGGDSIVASGPAKEGAMSFEIYKCAE